MDTTTFDPSKYLRKLAGRDYLEVKWRLLWLRTEQPDAMVQTELVKLEDGFALFKATVSLTSGAAATGYGSETRQDFPDFIEKAETKALGRALAALGFGTQFCEDHDLTNGDGTPHLVDSPVEKPAPTGALATPAQLKLIYLTATRDRGMVEEELDRICEERYGGRLPLHLTKIEASQFIDALKAGK